MVAYDDFNTFDWHDSAIHGFRILNGPGELECMLILDVDYIVEWLPIEDKEYYSIKMASADLSFYHVTGLAISINYASGSIAVAPMSIHKIHRAVRNYPSGASTFDWKIELNFPPCSHISFHASGFIQATKMLPVITTSACLSPSERVSFPDKQ